MLHPDETELTQSYKYNLHTINWLPTFLRGSLIFRIGVFFVVVVFFVFCFVPVTVLGIVKDWHHFFAIFRKWRLRHLLFHYTVSCKTR